MLIVLIRVSFSFVENGGTVDMLYGECTGVNTFSLQTRPSPN